VRSTSNAATLWRWVSQGDGDLVITGRRDAGRKTPSDLLPRIKKVRAGSCRWIIMSRAEHVHDRRIRASEKGRYELLPKPFDLRS